MCQLFQPIIALGGSYRKSAQIVGNLDALEELDDTDLGNNLHVILQGHRSQGNPLMRLVLS